MKHADKLIHSGFETHCKGPIQRYQWLNKKTDGFQNSKSNPTGDHFFAASNANVANFVFVKNSIVCEESSGRYFNLIQKWNDEYLSWNPNEFGGIKFINLPEEEVWTPDIVLYNK